MITFIENPSDLTIPVSDIYYHPLYARTTERIDNGTWECAVDVESRVAYSYIRREIASAFGHYNTITPYGYGGISAPKAVARESLTQFRSDYLRAALKRGLVTEVARLNPLDIVEPFLRSSTSVKERTTFGSDIENVDREFALVSGKHRTAVRKAYGYGVSVDEYPIAGLADPDHPFRKIYDDTMRRVNAREELRFGNDYYVTFSGLPTGSVRLLLAKLGTEIVAGGIFFVWRSRVHYHLSASTLKGRSLHATNLLIEAAKRTLVPPPFTLHLGGGRSESDSLASFKQRCSSRSYEMFVTETVVNPDALHGPSGVPSLGDGVSNGGV